RKQPHVVLDAVAWLRQRGFLDARALSVAPFGDPDYAGFFRARVAERRLTAAVHLLGYRTEVSPEIARDMTVFLLPATHDGLPGALIGAMASGLPAIVSDIGAMGRVVREAGCGWVLPADPEAIGKAVEQLWSDRQLWIDYSAAARRYARDHCDIDVVAHI